MLIIQHNWREKMKNICYIILLSASMVLFSACGNPERPDTDNQQSSEIEGKGNTDDGATTQEGKLGNKFNTDDTYNEESFEEDAVLPESFSDPASPLSKQIIYFDFDSSKVKPKFHDILLAYAEFLIENPGFNLVIEGHTDEKGTREYNIGLGERRGNAIKSMLELQGLSTNRLKVISYGEEKLANFDQDEISQSQNRRAVIVYTKR